MNYYIVVNKITKDIESSPATSGTSDSFTLKEDQEVIEINESLWRFIRKARSGAYYENGTIIPKPNNTPYDTWNYITKRWVTDTQAQLVGEAIEVRNIRAKLLSEMDIVVSNPIRWGAMSNQKQEQWVQYRQGLLDITQQTGFPLNVIYPTPPN